MLVFEGYKEMTALYFAGASSAFVLVAFSELYQLWNF
jgi:hypothetical protein